MAPVPVKTRDIKRQTGVLAVDIAGGELATRGGRMVFGQGDA